MVIDRLERRTVDHKQRPRDRRSLGAGAPGRPAARTVRVAPRASAPASARLDAEATRVVKVKRFAIEPMFEEDAISRMEELGHTFFIFVNAENERIAVLYRRRDGRTASSSRSSAGLRASAA